MRDPDQKFDGTKVFSDTHPEIERRMIDGIRGMSPAEKVAKMSDMGRFMKQAALAAMKHVRPDATEWECLMRVMSRSIPADIMLQAYNWDVREKGY